MCDLDAVHLVLAKYHPVSSLMQSSESSHVERAAQLFGMVTVDASVGYRLWIMQGTEHIPQGAFCVPQTQTVHVNPCTCVEMLDHLYLHVR